MSDLTSLLKHHSDVGRTFYDQGFFMKKSLLTLLALLPLAAFAQINGSGYYRVQNHKSQRFFMLIDSHARFTANNTDVDLGALRLVKGFEEKICWNPATICYMEKASEYKYNIIGEGLNLYDQVKTYLDFDDQVPSAYKGSYIISGEGTYQGVSMSKTLYDSERRDSIAPLYTSGANGYQYWIVRPVNDTYYFGIKPDFQAKLAFVDQARYYTTMYASFPYSFIKDSGVQAYYVSRIQGNYAVVKPLTAGVPGGMPVILECQSTVPRTNKVNIAETTVTYGSNLLQGVYFCNEVPETMPDRFHHNVVEYNRSSMRVLGATSDGRLAFVIPSDMKYIPANKAYLMVPPTAPATLYVTTEADLAAGIEQVAAEPVEPVKKGVYSLSGQWLGDSTDGLSRGVYIVNGRKLVMK